MRLARLSIVVFGMMLAGCATEASQPETSELQSAVSNPKVTEHWNPSWTDINTIWPATIPVQNGATITNTYVLIKAVPPDPYDNPQVAAFVVWNGNYVGHVYRARKGAELQSLLGLRDQAFGARLSGAPTFDAGGTGSPDVDPIPHPHPQGDCCEFVISGNEIDNAKTNAAAIHNATRNFADFAEM